MSEDTRRTVVEERTVAVTRVDDEASRRRRRVGIWLGALGVPLIWLVSLFGFIPREERTLLAKTRNALTAADIDLTGATIRYEGRDATITGLTLPDGMAVADVKRRVEDLYGVRVAHIEAIAAAVPEATTEAAAAATDTAASVTESTVAEPAPLATNATADIADGKVTLTGEVPSEEARAALVDAAVAAWGEGNVIDQLTVGGGAADTFGAAGLSALAGLFGSLQKALPSGSAVLAQPAAGDPTTLTITGEASDAASAQALEANATGLSSAEVAVTDQVTVAAPAPDEVEQAINEALELKPILFETASATILPASNRQLDRIARLIKQAGNVRITIQGHTDGDGDAGANQLLSEQRARAVRRALISRGVNKRRLRAVGFGESQPIASNDTEAGKQRNRRVIFVVKKGN